MPDLKTHDMMAPELIGFSIAIFDLELESELQLALYSMKVVP